MDEEVEWWGGYGEGGTSAGPREDRKVWVSAELIIGLCDASVMVVRRPEEDLAPKPDDDSAARARLHPLHVRHGS